MINCEEVDEELEEEVEEECGKYGTVQRVYIHNNQAKNEVHIYVLYQKFQEAQNAIQSLDQRYFGGRTITAESFSLKD